MKTLIERKLERIRLIAPIVSCDIYYNDLASEEERFVVRLYDPFYEVNKHFRSNHIRKSLNMALKWLNSVKE